MNSNRTTGFQDLVLFFARPTVVAIAVAIAVIGGYMFQSNGLALAILVPVGFCVAIALLGIAIGIVPRIMAFLIYSNYRAKVLRTVRETWTGK